MSFLADALYGVPQAEADPHPLGADPGVLPGPPDDEPDDGRAEESRAGAPPGPGGGQGPAHRGGRRLADLPAAHRVPVRRRLHRHRHRAGLRVRPRVRRGHGQEPALPPDPPGRAGRRQARGVRGVVPRHGRADVRRSPGAGPSARPSRIQRGAAGRQPPAGRPAGRAGAAAQLRSPPGSRWPRGATWRPWASRSCCFWSGTCSPTPAGGPGSPGRSCFFRPARGARRLPFPGSGPTWCSIGVFAAGFAAAWLHLDRVDNTQ